MVVGSQKVNPKDLPPVGVIIRRARFDYQVLDLEEGFFANAVVVESSRGCSFKVGEIIAVPYKVLIEDWKRMMEKERGRQDEEKN